MSNDIKCPNCGFKINVESVIASELEVKYKQELEQQLKKSQQLLEEEKTNLAKQLSDFEEKKKKENEIFSERLKNEKQKLETALSESLKITIAADFENQIKLLEEASKEKEDKLREVKKKELELLQKEKALEEKKEELDLLLERKILEERTTLIEQIRKQEQDRSAQKEEALQLKLKEKDIQLEEQLKLVEEMKRRSDQGSMQRQGEAQELLLEALLRENFPFDQIDEVAKGTEGADCIQIVRNQLGKDCGRIIYESKRTKSWNNGWIDKLKADMRSQNADVAILVTQTFPKEMKCFGEREGIWICSFSELLGVAHIIRQGILQVYAAHKREENKGDKMQMLYNYLTGNEFRGQIESIMEGFLSLRNSITKERIQMEKIWKEREKQLEKVLLNTSGLYGSVKGIAGSSVSDIPLLENPDNSESE